MVALNFQQGDRTNMLNRAMFLQNGNCGYVLKPSFLSDPDLYSLQGTGELDNSKGRKSKLKIRIHGHATDLTVWQSKVVPKNGLNPVWQEEAEFNIAVPELAIVEFKVNSK